MKSIIKMPLNLTKTKIKGITTEDTIIIVKVEPYKSEQNRCPVCGKKCRVYDVKQTPKYWRAQDIAASATYLEYKPVRVYCPEHGVHIQKVPWARHDSLFTKSFEEYVAYLSVYCTRSATSSLARIEWKTVGNICKRVYDEMEKQRDNSKWDNIKKIGIDETSYKKGHKYLTVVVDHDESSLLWAHEGKGSDVLELFFKKLTKEQCANIEVVTADGARWIKKVVKKYCKEASYCMDPFHVISWITEALDKVRQQEWRTAKNAADSLKPKKRKGPGRPKKEEENADYKKAKEFQDILKGMRFPLLKNFENLNESQEKKLENLKNLAGNHLFKAWEFKEDLRKIYSDKENAGELLDAWMHKTAYCKIKPVVEVEKKIRKRKADILKAIDLGIGNGRIEAINNKIKVTVKMGYGFRNIDNLIALLMLRCSDLDLELPFHKNINPYKIIKRKAA